MVMGRPVFGRDVYRILQDRLAEHAKRGVEAAVQYLERVICGSESEVEVLQKTGGLVSRPIPHAVRLRAVEVWRRLCVDKVLPDAIHEDVGEVFSMKDAVTEIAAEIAARNRERAAESSRVGTA